MDKKRITQADLDELMANYLDYLERLKDFQVEHREYIQDLVQRAVKEGWEIKPVDPQEIFNTDALIQEIDESGDGDEIEGFDKLKYKAEIYHQFQAFRAEGRYFDKRFKEIMIISQKGMLKFSEGWLKNAQKALLEGATDEGLPQAVKDMEASIEGMKGAIAVLELELAAMQQHLEN